MMFLLALISESVIVMPHVHIFKLSTIAFLNLRPRVLTAGSSGDGRSEVEGTKDLGEMGGSGAFSAAISGA